jgi:hypothetical protein
LKNFPLCEGSINEKINRSGAMPLRLKNKLFFPGFYTCFQAITNKQKNDSHKKNKNRDA